jgi:hypothetical protein
MSIVSKTEWNELKAEVLEEIVSVFEARGFSHSMRRLFRERIQSLRQSPRLSTPTEPFCEDEGCPHHGTLHICHSQPAPTEGKVELYRQVLRNTDSYVRSTVSYERDFAAEAVIAWARTIAVTHDFPALRRALSALDSSRGVNNG